MNHFPPKVIKGGECIGARVSEEASVSRWVRDISNNGSVLDQCVAWDAIMTSWGGGVANEVCVFD